MNPAEKIISRYLNLGYRLKRRIAPYRFTVVVLEKDGQEYFLKVGVKADKFFADRPLDQMWAREERFIAFINQRLESSNPKPPFRLPKFFERGQDEETAWTLQEYLSGSHIIEGTPIKEHQAVRWIPTMVEILQWFDRLSPAQWGPLDRDLKEEMLEKIKKHAENPLARGILTESELEQAVEIVEKYALYAKPAIQHGDFVPWHMHDDGFPNVVLIDLEAANLRFRYYDLAYAYHRFWETKEDPKLAKMLMTEFLKSVDDRENFARQIFPSLAARAIGGLNDWCIKGKNRSAKENKARLVLQRELLKKVLSEDLNVLI